MLSGKHDTDRLPLMKFSMLEIVHASVPEDVGLRSCNSLHPATQAGTAEDDLLSILVDDLGPRYFQVRHGSCGWTRRVHRPHSTTAYICVLLSLERGPHRTTAAAGATEDSPRTQLAVTKQHTKALEYLI